MTKIVAVPLGYILNALYSFIDNCDHRVYRADSAHHFAFICGPAPKHHADAEDAAQDQGNSDEVRQ